MQLLETTRQSQSSLAAYCRTGKLPIIPGIKTENVSHYRRLVYNVVDEILQNAYPLTHELLSAEEWESAVGDFFTHHPCQSPQVWYMPKEFYQYIAAAQHPLLKKYPFLEELLLFEWTEVELFMMEDKTVDANKEGDILSDELIINPEHQLLSFTYPVHNKNAKDITATDMRNYFVAAHRDLEGNVIFTDLSPAFVRLLEYLMEAPATLESIIKKFEEEFGLQLSEEDKKSVAVFFEDAQQQQLIIGFKKTY